MSRSVPVSAIAACYALSAFAVAIISGLATDRNAEAILESALISLMLCYVVGVFVARAADVAVRERLARLRVAEPVPIDESVFAPPPPIDEGRPTKEQP